MEMGAGILDMAISSHGTAVEVNCPNVFYVGQIVQFFRGTKKLGEAEIVHIPEQKDASSLKELHFASLPEKIKPNDFLIVQTYEVMPKSDVQNYEH